MTKQGEYYMGFGRMFLLGDWGNQMDIQDQKAEIEELQLQVNNAIATRDTTSLDERIFLLEKENGELRLYLTALIRHMGHKGILRQDEFRMLVEAIDNEDGSSDGSYKGKIAD
jgi:hypothetical protein